MKNIPHHAKCYFSSPDAAEPRNFTTEMQQQLAGHRATAQGYYDLEHQFQPQYQQLSLDQQAQGMYGYTDDQGYHHPGSLELGRTGTEYQRAGDISDVLRYGPLSTQAFLAANPYLARSLTNLEGRTQDSDILKTLNEQANAGLASGGQLSPQEQRALDQSSRSMFSDRGTLFGNQSIGSELLNRDAAVRARMQQAQQFASGVQGLNQNQNDFVGRAGQIFGTQLSDPFQAILGRPSGAGTQGQQQQIGSNARLFDPNNPYAADVFNSNFNAENARNIADSQSQNATTGAVISGVGSIIGGLLSDERLKTNVKDTGKKTLSGVPIKEFEYTTDKKKRRYRAVMAQDVERIMPRAVITDPLSGVKTVNYPITDAPFQRVEGRGKKKQYFNLVTGELEEAA